MPARSAEVAYLVGDRGAGAGGSEHDLVGGRKVKWSRGPAPKRIRKRLGTLLAVNLLARLDRGEIIDRNKTRNPKSPKTVKAPKALQKFMQQKEGRS